MKTVVLILFSTALLVSSNSIHNIRQPKEITQRRQILGFTNNIVHENPNYPDQSAQSNVKVDYQSRPIEPRKQIYTNNQYRQEFSQPYTQNYPTNAPQSQLFNVGYSVTFTNGNSKPVKQKYPRNNLDDGEIITGTRKQNEEVEGPTINMSPQEYVSAALISTKKQKISGIKPKPQLITGYQNPKILLSQANLSPSTQKYYKTLEQLKPQVQNTQELQQKYTWRNLSPSVEIIRSTEVPTGTKYTRTDQVQFDHGRALGRSQEFDYTNAIDSNPQQNALFYSARHSQPQAEQQQQIPAIVNQNVQKLPLDTTLLRETIPIQVDTRYIDEAVRNQAIIYNNKYQEQQQQQQQQPTNYLQQYRTIPVEENTETKPVQIVYRQEQPQGFQDYSTGQTRYQLKIYGKPQPILNFNDGQDEQIKRQPRYLNDIHTNLRPPPFDLYQKRIRVG